MDRIIVDSNVLFSAILNLNSNIGQILINGQEYYDFYSPKYVRTELLKHKDKIKKITGLTDEEFLEIYELVLKNVTILNHSILPEKDFKRAFGYCRDIDVDDTIFVGFSEYLKAKLWTGDKELTEGLENKGFKRIITTKGLLGDFIDKSKLGE
jgi:predicted nucleic acid-binding protein